jgi:mucin-2
MRTSFLLTLLASGSALAGVVQKRQKPSTTPCATCTSSVPAVGIQPHTGQDTTSPSAPSVTLPSITIITAPSISVPSVTVPSVTAPASSGPATPEIVVTKTSTYTTTTCPGKYLHHQSTRDSTNFDLVHTTTYTSGTNTITQPITGTSTIVVTATVTCTKDVCKAHTPSATSVPVSPSNPPTSVLPTSVLPTSVTPSPSVPAVAPSSTPEVIVTKTSTYTTTTCPGKLNEIYSK